MLTSLRNGLLSAAFATGLLACAPTALVEPGPATPEVQYLTRQEILTPLPLRVRLPAAEGAEHVVVLFRTWGSRGWRNLELARVGQTWSGEVSCREVSTVTGDTKYFFVVLNGEGELVGGSGSPDWPHVATIVGALPDGPQSLPGDAAILRCHDPADCPPDFPGCPVYTVQRSSCRHDRDCGERGRCAWDGYCGSPSGGVDATTHEPEEEDLELAVKAVSSRYRKSAAPKKLPGNRAAR
ncbi:hypothetical protein BH11MYX4_BH11MYX4_30150 [soil metagenome]